MSTPLQAPTGPWASRPVFVSSTFADMQAERDHLRSHVFPQLEERLRQRRQSFEPIDLRIGVETATLADEPERELLVLKVCLDEIERSRPFLVVLLGDRYGWVPAPERMAAAAQEKGYAGDLHGDLAGASKAFSGPGPRRVAARPLDGSGTESPTLGKLNTNEALARGNYAFR